MSNPRYGATSPLSLAEIHEKMVAVNEALVLGAVRQQECTEAAEAFNTQLQREIAAREIVALDLAEKARDVEGMISYWNHGAEVLYGWSREEALGKRSHFLLQTEFSTPVEQNTEELYRTGRWTGELVHTRRDGQRITVLARKSVDRDHEGSPIAVLQTLTDITERKRVSAKRDSHRRVDGRGAAASPGRCRKRAMSLAPNLRASRRAI